MKNNFYLERGRQMKKEHAKFLGIMILVEVLMTVIMIVLLIFRIPLLSLLDLLLLFMFVNIIFIILIGEYFSRNKISRLMLEEVW